MEVGRGGQPRTAVLLGGGVRSSGRGSRGTQGQRGGDARELRHGGVSACSGGSDKIPWAGGLPDGEHLLSRLWGLESKRKATALFTAGTSVLSPAWRKDEGPSGASFIRAPIPSWGLRPRLIAPHRPHLLPPSPLGTGFPPGDFEETQTFSPKQLRFLRLTQTGSQPGRPPGRSVGGRPAQPQVGGRGPGPVTGWRYSGRLTLEALWLGADTQPGEAR